MVYLEKLKNVIKDQRIEAAITENEAKTKKQEEPAAAPEENGADPPKAEEEGTGSGDAK